MGVLLLLGQLTERSGSKGYAIFCGLHLFWTGRGLKCWDGQKDRVIFWTWEKRWEIPPANLGVLVEVPWVIFSTRQKGKQLWHVTDFRSLILMGRTPEAATRQLSAVLNKGRIDIWNQEISPVQQGKDTLLIWLYALLNLSFKIFSILFGCLFSVPEARMG